MSLYPLALGLGSAMPNHVTSVTAYVRLTSRKSQWQAACPIPFGKLCKMHLLALALCKTDQFQCVAEACLTLSLMVGSTGQESEHGIWRPFTGN